MKPQSLFKNFDYKANKAFGGNLLKGNPRTKRPVSTKKPMHVVLRSSFAKGSFSMQQSKNKQRIQVTLKSLSNRFGVKVYRFANSGNHLHLLVMPVSRQAYLHFIRALSGIIARIVLNAERGSASLIDQFWDARPFTRIVEWGREFSKVREYIELNVLEAIGFRSAYRAGTSVISRYSG